GTGSGTRNNCRKRQSLRDELHGDAVHAMPRVLGRKAFAFKHMAEMAAAVAADDLDTTAVGVGVTLHRAGDLVVKAGPATVAVELVGRLVQRGVALPADVSAGGLVVGVLADEGALRPLVEDDAGFVGSQ